MRARVSSPLPWLGGLLTLYLLVPIVAFVVRLAGGAPASPGLGSALATSLFTATISTVVIVVLGTPLAYLMARQRGVAARVLLGLVALPLALPTLMSGILLLYVVGPFTIPGSGHFVQFEKPAIFNRALTVWCRDLLPATAQDAR